ncbi:MAG: 1,4-alpha-glucan branching protein GlgB [Christensenellaceae bacterium]|nr:1,4-alpha-glucan branching protein GlgB [Christensenellaceae bacterium]
MRYHGPSAEVREWFHQGTNRRAYEMLGAHPVEQEGREMWAFAVWAPNARAVSLIGEFNHWDKTATPMTKQFDGTWEVRVPAELFDVASDPHRYDYPDAEKKIKTYKYCVQHGDGTWHDKADPYGFAMQNRPDTASVICDLEGYAWGDADWIARRSQWDPYHSPVNIYEMHLGSWRRREDGTMMSYTEIADQLIPYIQEMGYTHVELLPVMEHPLDMSWGYQVSGYYAATARYGEPKELMELIDRCHQANIGVILDWVPAHFPRDAMGLRRFDGTACYEHPDPRRGDMEQWGTHMFDFARGEVCSFLLSNACFWLDWYHADGIRVDAVSAMLYYDFCREPGQWLPNQYGGHENLDAIAFLRRLNETVYHDFPGVMMIAEESSAYPMVTRPIYLGGLGFGFKWNMGWMNDMLSYIKLDPVYRKYHHDKLTFSLMYAFNENYILPFSHDEVVHGKHSMLDKQPGDLWRKFAGLRALYGYTMAHPGKKLLFMGSEFAHFIEWKFDDQLDWFLLLYDKHPQVQACVKALNRLYRENSEFWEIDDGWDGFQWIQANDQDHSITAFLRTDRKNRSILCVTNFTPVFYPEYRIGLPYGGTLEEIFNTDRAEWGGSNQYNAWTIEAQEERLYDFPFSATICVPPHATVYFRYEKIIPPPAPKKAAKAAAAEEAPKPKKAPARKKTAEAGGAATKAEGKAKRPAVRKAAVKTEKTEAPAKAESKPKRPAVRKTASKAEPAEAPKPRTRRKAATPSGDSV